MQHSIKRFCALALLLFVVGHLISCSTKQNNNDIAKRLDIPNVSTESK